MTEKKQFEEIAPVKQPSETCFYQQKSPLPCWLSGLDFKIRFVCLEFTRQSAHEVPIVMVKKVIVRPTGKKHLETLQFDLQNCIKDKQ